MIRMRGHYWLIIVFAWMRNYAGKNIRHFTPRILSTHLPHGHQAVGAGLAFR